MMANESRDRPPHRPLPEETLAALRASVLRHWNNPADGDADLREALNRVAAEAHERGMRAEELIVAFKQLWEDMPELHGHGSRADEVRFRERLITMSIKAYYNDPS
jgi:hypothetical protein